MFNQATFRISEEEFSKKQDESEAPLSYILARGGGSGGSAYPTCMNYQGYSGATGRKPPSSLIDIDNFLRKYKQADRTGAADETVPEVEVEATHRELRVIENCFENTKIFKVDSPTVYREMSELDRQSRGQTLPDMRPRNTQLEVKDEYRKSMKRVEDPAPPPSNRSDTMGASLLPIFPRSCDGYSSSTSSENYALRGETPSMNFKQQRPHCNYS